MKFNVYVNQYSIIKNGFGIDFNDAAILNLMGDFVLTGRMKKKQEGGLIYYWIAYKLVMEQLPMLSIGTKDGIYRRFKKLVALGLLIAHKDNQNLGLSYYAFSEKYHQMNFTVTPTDENTEGSVQLSLAPTDENTEHNTITDNNTNKGEAIFPERHEFSFTKKKDFIQKLLSLKTKFPDKYPKAMIFDFAEYWLETNPKNFKLKYENQQFFEIPKRLSSWFKKSTDQKINEFWDQEDQLDLDALLETL